MKFSLSLGALALALTASAVPSTIAERDNDLRRFEERLIERQNWQFANGTIKLLGYKRIDMKDEDRDVIETAIKEQPDAWEAQGLASNAWYDFVDRALRIYFPVRDALLWDKDELVEANENGELPHEHIDGDVAVLGRYQSADVHGVHTNVIRDGMILLSTPHQVLRKRGNVHIYDFGTREAHDHAHDHDHAKRGGKVSCFKNHGGKICSFLPGCRVNRCTAPKRSATGCVDYNGWPISDCKGKGKKGFVGSDCSIALAKGKCWNEIM